MRRKIINLAILIIGIGLIINLSRDILRLLKADDRISQAQQRVEELEKQQAELQEKKDYFESDQFVEEQARNKLNLSKEGEAVVILPPNVDELVGYQQPEETPVIPNWRQWLNLFM
jgi:cell division protein FtsB